MCFVISEHRCRAWRRRDRGFAGPSAVLTSPATSTTSTRSPTDTTTSCNISTPTYVGQRVVCSCLCVLLAPRSSAVALRKDAPRRASSLFGRSSSPKVRFYPSESESVNRSSVTSLCVNFVLATDVYFVSITPKSSNTASAK